MGERGSAAGGGISVAGESAEKGVFPLVKELAADRHPVAVALGTPPAESAARGETVPRALPPALLPVAGQPDHRQ